MDDVVVYGRDGEVLAGDVEPEPAPLEWHLAKLERAIQTTRLSLLDALRGR